MSSKVQRKVTVENIKESSDGPRRPSVFERLGGAVPAQECRNWMRSGACSYGTKCRYQHEAYPPTTSSSTSSARQPKPEREPTQKDLRHKVRHKQPDAKESLSRSPSPKRKKTSAACSRSRRPDAESKIKSTVVVTRPRSPSSGEEDRLKDPKPPKNWEGTSDDWPLDEASLDYKEELSLEMKRQQLQRELDLLQKENHLKGAASGAVAGGSHATITKTVRSSGHQQQQQQQPQQVPFSGSSESSSDSDSSSSDSSSSSSDDDDNDDSEDSSSSSSSGAASPIPTSRAMSSSAPTSSAPALDAPDRGRHHRSRRGAHEERPSHRGGADTAPPPSKTRDPPRSSSSHVHDKEPSRHGRERHGRSREATDGGRQSPAPAARRGQDVDYDGYGGRSRGPRTPSPGALSEPKRKGPSTANKGSAAPIPFVPPKPRKKKKSAKRRREREKQLRAEHQLGVRSAPPPSSVPLPDSPSPEPTPVAPPPRSGRRSNRDGARVPIPPPPGGGRYGSGTRSPARGDDALTPPHFNRGAPPPKRSRRESPSPPEALPPQPPPRDSRKKEADRHGRLEEYGSSHPKTGYEMRYEGDTRHQGSRKRDAPGYADPPAPPPASHRGRHNVAEDPEPLEPGEVMSEHGERYGNDRGRYDQGRGRDSRRAEHHRSRSASPAMGSVQRNRIEMELHRMSEYPHSPQPGRSRNPEPRGKPDPRGSTDVRGRGDPYPRGPDSRGDLRGDPRGDLRGDPYRRPEGRTDPHKPDLRPDYHGGVRGSDYHGRGPDPKADYHGRDAYGGRSEGRSDPYRSSDYRDGRDPHPRIDARKEPPPRMDRGDRGDPGYEPRPPDDYGRGGDEGYGRLDHRRDYYADGYGHRAERGSRGELRRPEHVSRLDARNEPPPLRGNGSRLDVARGDRRNDSRGRGERTRGPDLPPDVGGRPPGGYGSKSDRSDSRGRVDPHLRDEGKGRDFYERGEGYAGGRGGPDLGRLGPDSHRGEHPGGGGRGSDSRGDSGRRDYKGRAAPGIDDSGPSRYNRRELDHLSDVRDSRMGPGRDGRTGGRSRSPSPARSYERKRPPVRERGGKEPLKREDEASLKDADSREAPSSGGSQASSPRGRQREKPPASKRSRSSSRDVPPERHDQSPDTSVPEVVAPKMEAASPLSDDSGDESPTKAEVSDSSKHMVLVEECKSEDENEDGQEAKPGATETFSDWSDDEDDILTRDDPALEFVTKEPSSDPRNDATSQDKPEEAAETNLIEVDAVPISPPESHHSGEADPLGMAEDFDPISDDELEALIDDSEEKEPAPEPSATISDVLDIDWSSLVKETRPKEEQDSSEKRVSARDRYKGARVLARIGISKDLAGEELTKQAVEFCRSQLGSEELGQDGSEPEFKLEDLTAGFHVAAVAARKQQSLALQSCGRYCRALSARRDLMLRRALCKVYEPSSSGPAVRVDPELYKRSLELFQSRVAAQVPLKC